MGGGTAYIQNIVQVNKLAAYLTSHLTHLVIDENGEDSILLDYSAMTTKTIMKNT